LPQPDGYFDAIQSGPQGLLPARWNQHVPATLGVLSLVGTWIRAKRHMSVKVGGVEITGMSPREVEHILTILREGGTAADALSAADAEVDASEPENDHGAPRLAAGVTRHFGRAPISPVISCLPPDS
jgi:hypothetical protein